jgi:hypothetical protein
MNQRDFVGRKSPIVAPELVVEKISRKTPGTVRDRAKVMNETCGVRELGWRIIFKICH